MDLHVVETQQSNAAMPYPPAIRAQAGTGLLFLSGVTAMPLYHEHPHIPEEESLVPYDIREQTRLVMESIREILDAEGASFSDVMKYTKYVLDIREVGAIGKVISEYMDGWRPASTMVCVNNLSSPGARLEMDLIVAVP